MADREGFIVIASPSGGWGKLTSAQLLCRGVGGGRAAHAMRGSILPPICRQIITKSIRNNSVRDKKQPGAMAPRFTRPFRPPPVDRSLRRDKWSHRSLLARCSERWRRPHSGSHPYPLRRGGARNGFHPGLGLWRCAG